MIFLKSGNMFVSADPITDKLREIYNVQGANIAKGLCCWYAIYLEFVQMCICSLVVLVTFCWVVSLTSLRVFTEKNIYNKSLPVIQMCSVHC